MGPIAFANFQPLYVQSIPPSKKRRTKLKSNLSIHKKKPYIPLSPISQPEQNSNKRPKFPAKKATE